MLIKSMMNDIFLNRFFANIISLGFHQDLISALSVFPLYFLYIFSIFSLYFLYTFSIPRLYLVYTSSMLPQCFILFRYFILK